MLQDIAAIAGIGSFILAILALIWSKSNSDKIKELSFQINSNNIQAEDVNSKNQTISGNGNVMGGKNVSINKKNK